jgi:hypothetical protein
MAVSSSITHGTVSKKNGFTRLMAVAYSSGVTGDSKKAYRNAAYLNEKKERGD